MTITFTVSPAEALAVLGSLDKSRRSFVRETAARLRQEHASELPIYCPATFGTPDVELCGDFSATPEGDRELALTSHLSVVHDMPAAKAAFYAQRTLRRVAGKVTETAELDGHDEIDDMA